MKDYLITPHFSFYELTDSKEHPELVEKNRQEALLYVTVLKELCINILEPIRLKLNKPMIVTSGFRGPTLNKSVTGVPTSQHCLGQACDFIVKDMTPAQIIKLLSPINPFYGQLIAEYKGSTPWIHVSLGMPYRKKERCNERLYYNGKEYVELTDKLLATLK